MIISIVVAFYKGNKFLERLLTSIEKVEKLCNDDALAKFEILLVNDSPNIKVKMPKRFCDKNNIKIISNEKNVGIHRTRVNGLKHSSGEWVIFLDQDDELLVDGFRKQVEYAKDCDVVVGNGFYQRENKNIKIYDNIFVMNYLIQGKNFLRIRNLIPSPGECLIRKNAIPKHWQNNYLIANGADDWYLWLLMFKSNKKFVSNSGFVYIHNDNDGQNLSSNLDKMHISCQEMSNLLEQSNLFLKKEIKHLRRTIDFKYYQDRKKLDIYKLIKYCNVILDNVIYKIHIYINKGKSLGSNLQNK